MTREPVELSDLDIGIALFAITGDMEFSSADSGIDIADLRAAAAKAGLKVGSGRSKQIKGLCKRGHDQAVYRKVNKRGEGFCAECQRARAREYAAKKLRERKESSL